MSEVDDPTRLERELAEQTRWQPRPAFAGATLFEQLVREEFLDAETREAHRRRRLATLLRHAAGQVPWWQRRFEALNAGTDALLRPGGLERLPVLDRETARTHWRELHARRLPAGEVLAGPVWAEVAGVSLEVPRTARAQGVVGLLMQRALRWFRFDPGARLAAVRRGRELPPPPDGAPLEPGRTLDIAAWQHVGHLFETGPQVALLLRTPLARQIPWLRENASSYLAAPADHLEQLAVAFSGDPARPSPAALMALSQPLGEDSRDLIESVFGARVFQQYRLAEAGPVAATCVEGGRYHVHDGDVLAEIVDAEGRACRAGERGRLLVGTLTNLALPLLRYDTGVTAEATEGPCACGRTLSSFVRPERAGLARHVGLAEHRRGLLRVLTGADESLTAPLRAWQLTVRADGEAELALAAETPPASALAEALAGGWREADQDSGIELRITVRSATELVRDDDGSVPVLLDYR